MEKKSLLSFLKNEYNFDCNLKFLIEEHEISEIVAEIIDWIQNTKHDYIEVLTFARDFYIGSDLNETNKNEFYSELQKQDFFKVLETNLYCGNFEKISYTIYTIGKFSNYSNAILLEKLYESGKITNNLFLIYRCLNELDWLGSKKFPKYLIDLKNENSLYSNFVLLYFYDVKNKTNEIEKILSNQKFKKVFKSRKFVLNKLFKNLLVLENSYNENQEINWNKTDFENLILDIFLDN